MVEGHLLVLVFPRELPQVASDLPAHGTRQARNVLVARPIVPAIVGDTWPTCSTTGRRKSCARHRSCWLPCSSLEKFQKTCFNLRCSRIEPSNTMRKAILLFFLVSLVSARGMAKGSGITVEIKDATGKDVGTVKIKSIASGVELKLNLRGLVSGEHAIHFHQNAKCEAPDFKSAGPHFNPDGKMHGLENPMGAHAGDMLNFTVDAKGNAKATIVNKSVNLGTDSHSLYSNGGTSLVVHAKADDMKTDPAGNAGDRIACGLIVK